jgi:uncharacterized protein YggE
MTSTIRTFGAAALGAMVVAVAVLAVRPAPAAGAPATGTEPAPHSITVSATGKLTLVPDVAHVSVGVQISKPTVKAARESAAKAMSAIVAALKGLGIDEKDLQTTGLSLYPQYANGSSTRIVGYQLSEQLQITVRDLDKAGDVVDAAMAKGANTMNGIWFDVGDPAKAMNDARANAVTAARVSAQAMASAAGVNLGAVLSISEGSVSPWPYPAYGAERMSAVDAATPVLPGTQDLQATVTVTFEID